MPTLKDYNDTDEQNNPSSKAARELSNREQQAGQGAGINAGIDQAEAFANDPKNATRNIDTASQQESNPFNFTPSGQRNSTPGGRLQKIVGFARSRKGATTGIFGGVSIAGILISMLFSGFTSLINIQSNALNTNDSRSNILERRLEKWIQKKTGNVDSACDVSKYACRMGKMPNKMLSRMSEQGIIPLDADGKEIKIDSESGYADKNPKKYKIPSAEGTRVIEAANFAKEYKKSPILRASFKRVYSMRYRAWVGKTINKVFYSTFKLRQDGGVASDDKKLSADTIDKELDTLLDSSSTKSVDTSKQAFSDRFKSFFKDDIGRKIKSSGGSATLLAGAGYCLGVNTPRIVADAYRAVQLAQILVLANDVILSPAGKIKAGDARPEDASAIGSKLTESVAGKSALDSPILQSAIGANRNKTAASKYAPGYSLYHSSIVQDSSSLSSSSKGFCSKITSPQAQLAADGIEAGISAGTLGTGAVFFTAFKAVLKGAIIFGAVDAAITLITNSSAFNDITNKAFELASKYIGDYTQGIRGEKLGDALGVGLFAYFSMSGLRGGSAVLKKDQIVAYNESMDEVNNQYREEAVATLSPFDASSQYTFMGSLVSKLQLSGFGINKPIESLSTLGSLVLGAPSTLFSQTASAASVTDVQAAKNRCDNNAMFDIEDDIGVNPAGYPCVGIPAQYLDMSVDDVQKIVANDTDPDTGDVKSDSDIANRQADCGNANLTSIGGCTIENTTDAAQSLYQYDKNVSDILDGSDDQPINTGSGGSSATPASTGQVSAAGDLAWPLDKKWWTSNQSAWLGPHISTGTAWGADNMGTTDKGSGIAADIGTPPVGSPVYAMLGGTVTSTNLCGSNDGVAIKSNVNGKTLGIAYMHGTNQKVKVGDTVQPGQQIESLGAAGCTVYGAHLHVGIAYDGKYLCPQLVFQAMGNGDPVNWADLVQKSRAPCGI